MKTLQLTQKAILIVSLMTSLVSSVASAATWTCEAQSPVAFGVGMSSSRGAARAIAINECRMRTPFGMYCYVVSCEKEDSDSDYSSRDDE